MSRLLTPEEEFEYYQYLECIDKNLYYGLVDYRGVDLNLLKSLYEDKEHTVDDLFLIDKKYFAELVLNCKCDENPIENGTRLICNSCLTKMKNSYKLNHCRKETRNLSKLFKNKK